MAWFWNLNLIHFFNFYLWLTFIVSTYRRFGQYRSILGLVGAVPGRWPHLFRLVKDHSTIFLTWSTILPGLVVLGLTVVQTLASNFIWPEAGRPPYGLTVDRLAQHWPAISAVILVGLSMVAIDMYATFSAGEIDRQMMQEYFDQAEYWLKSWTAPVVRVFTLGYVHPRRMVAVEVRKALVEASLLINTTLWWVSLQIGLRVVFGLVLWIAYALDVG